MELAGYTSVLFAWTGNSPTNHRVSDIAMSRKDRRYREVFSVALPTSQNRSSTKATSSPPLDHENNTGHSNHSEPRRLL